MAKAKIYQVLNEPEKLWKNLNRRRDSKSRLLNERDLAGKFSLKSLNDLEEIHRHPGDFEDLCNVEYIHEKALRCFQKSHAFHQSLELLRIMRNLINHMAEFPAETESEKLYQKSHVT